MSLDPYRAKRDPGKTPEPVPAAGDLVVDHTGDEQDGRGDTFVVQEHHATALHWDVRLERDGVLVSWAVPKGLPLDPATNHLAKQTEDHPLAYATFAGDIPKGEYGGGQVTIWDSGTYALEKWQEREVKVVLRGSRIQGRYVFFRTRGKDWMVHRMDGPPAGWAPLPAGLSPMLASAGPLPTDDENWSFEVKWDGVRALVAVDGGRLTVTSRNGNDVTGSYPELRGLGLQLGSRQVLLDGELVAFAADGRTDFGALQARMHVGKPGAALLRSTPVQLLLFDLLHLSGTSLLGRSYDERRAALEGLALAGPHWQVPPVFAGGGASVLEATRAQGLEGVVAKRRDSPYTPGRRSERWIKVKNIRRTSAVIAGWKPGAGGRAGRIGSLLLGVHGPDGLEYAGHVGTGFSEATLALLAGRLEPLRRADSPFGRPVPREHAKDAVWVSPELVIEVDYTEWTRDGRLRHPSYKGLRDDYDAGAVVRD
ncbi:MAG TPA: non-homologous end-joining DNA ligase [Mycobacteriales bacterium]|jgi:bifunctional non-homologous end joining protein LigD|nr:non-homologous end-joining DNA ligase [Mycobacteriales bacterium]